eukprot:CAMPEP_0177636806 /NCGR_PEP_ID=MMETSP0447-20121125/4632_1 /TAXON_ID=0 /ORGANISM="Stygamoeba regulata, Strain BSH-02190019" /LENGTH=330 /DNA_ID=CAMNT_0019138687 /DNA_START=37 /DNA_END=1030 /DNA_ORIENTATION=-
MDALSQLDEGSINFLQECEAKAVDNDDMRNNDSGDEIEAREDRASLMAELQQDQEKAAALPPPLRSKHNTGPKGVLADYKEAKRELRDRRLVERQRFYDKLAGKQVGGERPRVAGVHLKVPNLVDEAALASDEELNSDEELLAMLEEEDDEFIKDWAVKRFTSMLGHATIFGSVTDVSADAFLEEVDKAPKDVHVVVHVYRHRVEACSRLALQLRKLAAAHTHVKFISMNADEYKKDYDDVALPTLLIYKGGELVQSFIPLCPHFLKPGFTLDNLEELLYKEGYLKAAISKETKEEEKKKKKEKLETTKKEKTIIRKFMYLQEEAEGVLS